MSNFMKNINPGFCTECGEKLEILFVHSYCPNCHPPGTPSFSRSIERITYEPYWTYFEVDEIEGKAVTGHYKVRRGKLYLTKDHFSSKREAMLEDNPCEVGLFMLPSNEDVISTNFHKTDWLVLHSIGDTQVWRIIPEDLVGKI